MAWDRGGNLAPLLPRWLARPAGCPPYSPRMGDGKLQAPLLTITSSRPLTPRVS